MEDKVYPRIKNAILLCLLILGIQIGLGIILGLSQVIFNISNVSLFIGVLTALTSIISFGVAILIGFKKTKRKFNDVFKFNNVSPYFWIATTIFMIGLVFVVSELDNLLNFILPMPDFFHDIFETLMTDQIFVFAIIIMGIIPAFTEELFFRGLVLDGFVKNYSKKKAILISALLFGLVHLNPWQFLGAFIIGIFAAWICINTNSIILCIYVHLFNNVLYTTVEKFRDFIPIRGFNTNNITPVEFQPIWLDLISVIILIAGLIMLKRGFDKQKTVQQSQAC